MIVRWEQGRTEVDRLIAEQRVQRVSPSRDLADLLIAQSRVHLHSAEALLSTDVPGAFQLAYDSARKSLAAILAYQGLRATGMAAHVTLFDVVMAQLHPPLGSTFESFGWMRRLRNTTEYPDVDKPIADTSDVIEAVAAAERIIDAAEQMLANMPVY